MVLNSKQKSGKNLFNLKIFNNGFKGFLAG